MATQIILTSDDDLTPEEIADLRYLLSDALDAFAKKRENAREYVSRNHRELDEHPDLPAKVEQVRRRAQLARKLHPAALSPVIITDDASAAGQQPFYEWLRKRLAHVLDRQRATLVFLQEAFGMTEEEARSSYNLLEDKRITKQAYAVATAVCGMCGYTIPQECDGLKCRGLS